MKNKVFKFLDIISIMFECLICYNNKKKFKILHNNHKNTDFINDSERINHKICFDCYKKLLNPTCPFCRTDIILYQKKEKINKYKENIYINTERIERKLKRKRRRDFKDYNEYLENRRRIKQNYKNERLQKFQNIQN